MKKFTSILCALAIALSVSAAPVGKKVLDTKVQRTEKNALKATKEKKEFKTKFKAVDRTKAVKVRAPKAKKAVNNITIGRFGFQNYGGGDIFYALISEDESLRFDFDFLLENTEAEDIESGVTYTIDNLDTDYSYGSYTASYDYFEYSTVAFKKTVENEKIKIEVAITDENGDEWNLLYDEASMPEAPQGGTFVADVIEGNYFSSTSDIQYVLTATEAKLVFYFDIKLPEGSKDVVSEQVYTEADFDLEYSAVVFNKQKSFAVATATFKKTVAEDGSYTIEGTIVDELDQTWNISGSHAAPVIPEGGDFEMVTLNETFYSSDNDVYVILKDANDNTFRFDIVVAEGLKALEIGHEYTLDDMIAKFSKGTFDGVEIIYASAKFIKTLNEDGSGDINVEIVDENSKNWKLHYAIPEPLKPETFETITAEVTYTSEEVWFWTVYTFTAADDNNAIEFSITPDESFYGTWAVGGDNGIEGTVTPAEGEASKFVSGEIVIAQSAEGFTVTGKVLCENKTEYTLNLTWLKPNATRQAELTISGLELSIYESEGAWQLDGYNEDKSAYVSIVAYAEAISGTYTAEDLEADYCSIYTDIVWGEDGYIESYKQFTLLDANLTVAFNEEDQTITITGTFVGMNGEDVPEFTLNLTGSVPAPQETNVTVSYYVKEFYEEDNDVFYMLVNEDETNAFRFDIPLPAGEKDVKNDQVYTLDDMIADYSWLGASSSSAVAYQSASFTKHVSEKGAVSITATILDKNGDTWNLSYTEPDPEEVLEESLTIDNLELNAKEGEYWQIAGYSADKNYYVSLAAITSTFAGAYTADELATSYCYIVKDASNEENYSFYDVREANLTVTYENGVLRAVGTVLTGKRDDLTKQIKFTIDFSSKEPTAVDNINADAVAVKAIENGQLIINVNGVRYNAVGATIR